MPRARPVRALRAGLSAVCSGMRPPLGLASAAAAPLRAAAAPLGLRGFAGAGPSGSPPCAPLRLVGAAPSPVARPGPPPVRRLASRRAAARPAARFLGPFPLLGLGLRPVGLPVVALPLAAALALRPSGRGAALAAPPLGPAAGGASRSLGGVLRRRCGPSGLGLASSRRGAVAALRAAPLRLRAAAFGAWPPARGRSGSPQPPPVAGRARHAPGSGSPLHRGSAARVHLIQRRTPTSAILLS